MANGNGISSYSPLPGTKKEQMKKQHYIAIGVLIIIILLVVFRKKIAGLFKKTTTALPSGNSGGSAGAGNTATTQLNYNKLLKQGVTGAEVRKLQQLLGNYYTGIVDGDFGPKTAQALFNRKRTIEITLAQYPTWPDYVPEPDWLIVPGDDAEGFDSTQQNLFNPNNTTLNWVP